MGLNFNAVINLQAVNNSPRSDGGQVSLPVTMSGTGMAPAGVENVLVGIRDQQTSLWWNNGSWGKWILNPVTATPTSETSVNWTTEFDPTGSGGSGKYRVFARIRDTEGNLSDSTSLKLPRLSK